MLVFLKKIPSNLYTFKDLRDEKCFKKVKCLKYYLNNL